MTTIFTDTFEVTAVNPEQKVFDKIDRLKAKADTYDCELLIDVNSDLWKVKKDQKIVMNLASSLTDDVDDGHYKPNDDSPLLATAEYAMHGRVYNFKREGEHNIQIDVSFGGLLMQLTGDYRHLSGIKLDENIYCLLSRA